MKTIDKVGAALIAVGGAALLTGELIGVVGDGPTVTGFVTATIPGLVLALAGIGVLTWHLLDDYFGG